jgi:cytochrome c556
MKHALLLGLALTAIPLAAAAQSQAPAPSLTPEQIVEARRAAFFLSGGSFAQMKATADAGGDVKGLVFPARTLARWARTLPSMFPAGSAVPPSKAKAEIWSDRAGFEAAAAAYAEAAGRLAEAAQAGDRAAFVARWTEVRGACGACHDAYRND